MQIFISTSEKLSVILFDLRPHEIITLNIVVGLDEYLLNSFTNIGKLRNLLLNFAS